MDLRILKYKVVIILITFTLQGEVSSSTDASKIYCDGSLLDLVQKAHLYKDSKTFVDMKMKYPVEVVMSRFKSLLRNVQGTPSRWSLKRFVRKHFLGPGVELVGFRPHDWKEYPKILSRIHDNRLKVWAKELNSYWAELCRKVKPDVRDHPDQYSLIYLPNPIVVAGDKYTEFHYWDSYWILLGILRSEMYSTAKGILENLITLVEKYGIVPSGGRIYHVTRSQLPLLLPMTKLYYEFTKDLQFIESNINTLESEFQFWMESRCVEIARPRGNITLAHYDATVPKPRPESYREDVELASNFSTSSSKEAVYLNLRAASETGWDFSSRWLIKGGSRSKSLIDIKTRDIIPVDLNAVLCWNAKILSEFFTLINEDTKSSEYKMIANEWQTSLTALLWSEVDGTWYDYDYLNKKSRKYFYASNLTPLWTKCYDKSKTDHIATKVVDYLTELRITYYEGGVPLSIYKTEYTYDFPTVLPPLQHIIIMGLKYTENWEAKELAFKLAFNWIRANYKGFIVSGLMFDKYHCEIPGAYGGEDDFPDQLGYGWTNGVCLDLLYTYGSVIHAHGIDASTEDSVSLPKVSVVLIFLLQVSLRFYHLTYIRDQTTITYQ